MVKEVLKKIRGRLQHGQDLDSDDEDESGQLLFCVHSPSLQNHLESVAAKARKDSKKLPIWLADLKKDLNQMSNYFPGFGEIEVKIFNMVCHTPCPFVFHNAICFVSRCVFSGWNN